MRPLFLFLLLIFLVLFFFSFSFVFFLAKKPLLAFVSGFNKRCFLRSRCSMEMWCPDDTGRDSWDWFGPPTWESMIQLPSVAWDLPACQNGASPDCIIVVVSETT